MTPIPSAPSLVELLLFLLLFSVFLGDCHALSLDGPWSRRDVLKTSAAVGGGALYVTWAANVLSKVTRGMAYPAPHENRVQDTITTTLTKQAEKMNVNKKKLRVLEVGAGKELRLLQRGLYNDAFRKLQSMGFSGVDLTAIDLESPQKKAMEALEQQEHQNPGGFVLDFHFVKGDVTTELFSAETCFDCIICCLTLCSVNDQRLVLEKLVDLLQSGGTFGFVEHVAVEPDEPYRFLEWQQQLLDPLQQKVASNCHLHRHTQDNILSVFAEKAKSSVRVLENERFIVDDMWPVSCQCRGVIQIG